jgi:hypothetical protein
VANLYANLPMPAGNGPGAAVDTSQMGRTKSVMVAGSFAGATVTIEISTDGGVGWAPLYSFQDVDVGKRTFYVACNRMRVNVSGRVLPVPFSANADVGAFDNPPGFVNLPMPVLNGPGAAVDVSAFGRFMTIIASGEFPGAGITIEASEDGTGYIPLTTYFGRAGLFTDEIVAQFLRVNVSGRNDVRPFTATVDAGLGDFDTGAGGGGAIAAAGREILPEVWAQNDVPANQAATAMPASVSQIYDDYQAIRPGSIIGLNVRFNAVLAAGQATAEVTVNGVGTGFLVNVAAPASSGRATQLSGLDNYVAGDLIGVRLSTNAGFLPADSLDVEVSVEVDTGI